MRDYNYSLSAGVEQQIRVDGDYVGVYTAVDPIELSVNSGAWFERVEGDEQKFQRGFDDVRVRSVTNQNIVLVVGYGDLRSNAPITIGTVNATINSPNNIFAPAHVSCAGTATTLLVAAHANTQKIFIKNPFTNTDPIFLGPAGIVANQGTSVDPGEGIELDCRAAVYAYNPKATAQNIYVSYLRS